MGNRRNNPQDMRISEELEKIKETFCNDYCKHWADVEKRAKYIKTKDPKALEMISSILQEELSKHCDHCPLSRL